MVGAGNRLLDTRLATVQERGRSRCWRRAGTTLGPGETGWHDRTDGRERGRRGHPQVRWRRSQRPQIRGKALEPEVANLSCCSSEATISCSREPMDRCRFMLRRGWVLQGFVVGRGGGPTQMVSRPSPVSSPGLTACFTDAWRRGRPRPPGR